MESTKQLTLTLKQLIRLLKKEHKALVSNDNNHFEKLVKQKEQLVEELAEMTGTPTRLDIKLIEEVKNLQDSNLLLTKQAIAFNDNFIKAVGETAKKSNATYSKKGGLSVQEDIGFINQSF